MDKIKGAKSLFLSEGSVTIIGLQTIWHHNDQSVYFDDFATIWVVPSLFRNLFVLTVPNGIFYLLCEPPE